MARTVAKNRSLFVGGGRVAIREWPEDELVVDETGQPAQPTVIYIREKMDYGSVQRVQRALMPDPTMRAGAVEAKLNMEDHALTLLLENIVAWEGPGVIGPDGQVVAITRENILHLDPNSELMQRVQDEIALRNKKPSAPDPKSLTTSGSSAAGEALWAGTIRNEQLGNFDRYVRLAMDPPHWTPQQIDAMDPDFLTELETAMAARAEHRKKEAEKTKKKGKRR